MAPDIERNAMEVGIRSDTWPLEEMPTIAFQSQAEADYSAEAPHVREAIFM